MSDPHQRAPSEAAPPVLDRREDAILEASTQALALLLERRSIDLPIRALAAELGLSERTFYRYFPRKELVIRPALLASLEAMARDIRDYPASRPLQEALVVAHDRAYASGHSQWDALIPLLRSDDSLQAVWRQLLVEAEAAMGEAIAARLGIPRDSQKAALIGAVVVAAGRIAVERGSAPGAEAGPGEILPELLGMLGGGGLLEG